MEQLSHGVKRKRLSGEINQIWLFLFVFFLNQRSRRVKISCKSIKMLSSQRKDHNVSSHVLHVCPFSCFILILSSPLVSDVHFLSSGALMHVRSSTLP